MQNQPTRARLADSAVRILTIMGFVAVLGIGMWGSVSIARYVPGTLSTIASAIVSITSIFVPSTETISLTTPTLIVQSDAPTAVAFAHANKSVAGTYSFKYSCVDGVSIAVLHSDVGSETEIACNEVSILSTGTVFTIRPVSETNRFADLELFVSFTPEGAATATVTGSTLITIENRDLTKSPSVIPEVPSPTPATPVTKPTPKPGIPSTPITIQVPVTTPSDPNGFTDLVPRIIEVGTVDTAGTFTASTTPSRRDRVAVRFAVENIGTKTSKEFTFSAVLPTFPPYTYFSGSQPALSPGDRIEYTIGFDATKDASAVDFVVNVDPTGSVNERNKDNNIIHYTVYVAQ